MLLIGAVLQREALQSEASTAGRFGKRRTTGRGEGDRYEQQTENEREMSDSKA